MIDPELKTLSDRLSALMADPEPGLISWKFALGRTLLRLAAFCGIDPICAEAHRLSELPEYKLSNFEYDATAKNSGGI
jgi:hypothetical protein